MNDKLALLFFLCVTFVKVNAQKIELPRLESPENNFYAYLENEQISNPEKFYGKVKKVVKTIKQSHEEEALMVGSIETFYMNKQQKLEKSIERFYWYGVEESAEETEYLKTPKFTVKKKGTQTIKILKKEFAASTDYAQEFLDPNDYYIYEKDRLVTFYNANDSISYTYNNAGKLTQIRYMESILSESYDEDGTVTIWKSQFVDRALEKISYTNGLPKEKKIYSKYDESINTETISYTYTAKKQLLKYQTTYSRYHEGEYSNNYLMDGIDYSKLSKAEEDKIQTGTYTYTASGQLKTYQIIAGDSQSKYTLVYDKANRLHKVIGNLQTTQEDEPNVKSVEYAYLYDDKGNPKIIRQYTLTDGKKELEEEITFEITYYQEP
ncbi:hypothetical protein [Kordia zhangzhouensis]|uniref:hypothetical protein n=1 Tax=Kordia zhangzhouensis TaxID=1620405 RepID=UPI00062965D2|nr:hypothetical protein [Kordia zhangzhouensis]